ncbi:MAG: nucleotide exchange factor GrpE [Cyanobacteria bacterium P01_H01_bin.119]
MIDEVNPNNESQAPENPDAASIEELDADVADMEIDFGQGFSAPGAAEADSPSGDSLSNQQADSDVAQEMESTTVGNAAGLIEDLERQMVGLKAQLEDRTGQYVRIAADFENFRKRTGKEKQDMELQIKCTTISELLPVVDNFERARSQIKPQTEQEATIHKSYQGVYKQLVDCLKRLGVAPMRSEGQPFDPMLHEAVMREPTEEYPEDTVIEELVRGYLLGERVLRHAMVKVSAAPEPQEEGAIAPEPEAQ